MAGHFLFVNRTKCHKFRHYRKTEIPSTDSNSPSAPNESSPLATSWTAGFAAQGFLISVTLPVLSPEPACATYSPPPGPNAKPRGLCSPSSTTVYGPAANAGVTLRTESKRRTPNKAMIFFMNILLGMQTDFGRLHRILSAQVAGRSRNLGEQYCELKLCTPRKAACQAAFGGFTFREISNHRRETKVEAHAPLKWLATPVVHRVISAEADRNSKEVVALGIHVISSLVPRGASLTQKSPSHDL